MNTLIAPQTARPRPQTQTAAEIDRAYVRLAAAIVDVPDEVILAILISKGSILDAGVSVSSH